MKNNFILIFILPGLLTRVTADIMDEFMAAKPIYLVIPNFNIETSSVEQANDSIAETQHDFIEFGGELVASNIYFRVNKTNLKVGDVGAISTPKYPQNYPAQTNCEWNLESENGTVIEITFFDFYTQSWFLTYFDYVIIAKNGDYSTADKVAGNLNGETPFTIVSEANKIGIRFHSSLLLHFRGIKINYVVKPATSKRSAAEPETQEENSPFDGTCGISNLVRVKNEREDIIAPSGSFPWMAALLIYRDGADGQGFCGGSIISKRHILTAAHCTYQAKRITVMVGTERIWGRTDQNYQLFNVSKKYIYSHVSFSINSPDTVTHDVSVLYLDRDIQFNENVKPICIPNRNFISQTFVGEDVQLSGWGYLRHWFPAINPELKNFRLKVISNADCRRGVGGIHRLIGEILVSGNWICTGTGKNAAPCRGDSGSPLIVKRKSASGQVYFMQVGIYTFGGAFCESGVPIGFTRVTAFLDFISEMTGKNYF